MGRINLLKETLGELAQNGQSPESVRWVGNSETAGSWADFAALADFEYSNGYGGNEISMTLKVVGDDWWLERHEYDGSEWWEFKRLPVRPATAALGLSDVTDR